MQLTKNELEKIDHQEHELDWGIARMCQSDNYESLDIECMKAKDKIDGIYKLLRKHLQDEHGQTNKKKM